MRSLHPSPTRAALARAESSPAELRDDDYVLLLEATGDDLDTLTALANDLRRYTVGEAISIVANRNLDSGRLHEYGLDGASAVAADAADLGATELCAQGMVTGPATLYPELARAITRAAPSLHLHAFRPADVDDFARRSGLDLTDALVALREAGVDTVPGTGVKVLDESVRARVAPADLPVERWIEIVRAAHALGIRSSSVLFYGHVETALERIRHLRTLSRMQDEAGGFTEFVPIPLPGWGVGLVPGRSMLDEHRAMHATARLLLHGRIPHLQVPWTRVGIDACPVLLSAGADDLGGTLYDGRVLPESAAEYGTELRIEVAERIAASLFRPLRQRTTVYGEPAAAPSTVASGSAP